jgi:hypothetical protein
MLSGGDESKIISGGVKESGQRTAPGPPLPWPRAHRWYLSDGCDSQEFTADPTARAKLHVKRGGGDGANGQAWSSRDRRANDSPGIDQVGVADVEDGPGPGQQGGKDASLVGAAIRATPPHDPIVTEHERDPRRIVGLDGGQQCEN